MMMNNSSMIIYVIVSIVLILLLMVVSSSKNIVSTNITNDSITSNDMNKFLDYNNSDHILDKTIYSNYSRLLLVAGIDIHY